MITKSKLVPTTLDFCPNFKDNKVNVILDYCRQVLDNGRFGITKHWYVSINGQDDVFLQTEDLSFDAALYLFDSIDKVTEIELHSFKNSINNNGWPRKLINRMIDKNRKLIVVLNDGSTWSSIQNGAVIMELTDFGMDFLNEDGYIEDLEPEHIKGKVLIEDLLGDLTLTKETDES